MATKKRQPIQSDLQTYEKLKYMAIIKHQPMSTFLKEIIDQMFQIGMNFNDLNIEYQVSIIHNTLVLEFSGKNRFFIGNVPPPQYVQRCKKT